MVTVVVVVGTNRGEGKFKINSKGLTVDFNVVLTIVFNGT